MRYVLLAVVVVAAIIAALLYLPEHWGQDATQVTESGTKVQGDFVDLPPPDEPDYTTVVTDEALAQELETEANSYLEEISRSATTGKAEQGSDKPLLLTKESQLTWAGADGSVAEVLSRYGITPQTNELYFAHPVSADDDQGVWGIVQEALITRFADGIAVRRRDNQQTYRLLIPQHADERKADGSSSFLGRVIWHKTQNAQVINTKRGWARESVNVVVPGQDLVIVGFEREQLVAIYQYFATASQ